MTGGHHRGAHFFLHPSYEARVINEILLFEWIVLKVAASKRRVRGQG